MHNEAMQMKWNQQNIVEEGVKYGLQYNDQGVENLNI